MMINLTNSAAKIIPGSDRICPLIMWIWLSITFVVAALIEYFIILTILKFSKKKVTIKLQLFDDQFFRFLQVSAEPQLKPLPEKKMSDAKDPWAKASIV